MMCVCVDVWKMFIICLLFLLLLLILLFVIEFKAIYIIIRKINKLEESGRSEFVIFLFLFLDGFSSFLVVFHSVSHTPSLFKSPPILLFDIV